MSWSAPHYDSVADLAKHAELPPMDHKTDIKRYYRSADMLLKQGKVYKEEGDLEQSYIMLLKYLTLVVSHLPRHKGYGTVEKVPRKKVEEVMGEMELLKKELNKLYEQKAKAKEEEKKAREAQSARLAQEARMAQEREYQARMRREAEKAQPIREEDAKLSFQRMQQEIVAQQKAQLDNFQVYRQKPPVPDQPTVSYEGAPPPELYLPQPTAPMDRREPSDDEGSDGGDASDTEPQGTADTSEELAPQPLPIQGQPFAFPPGGFPMGMPFGQPMMFAPPTVVPHAMVPMALPSAPQLQPEPKQPPKPDPTPLSPSGLRRIFMDGEMFDMFMKLAKNNTDRNIETCGILAGKLKQNAFYITQLIIPKQEGSSDTCSMTNEDEVFNYQEEEQLMTLGWIHTHPNHDLFLSSVDMHTHFSYQVLLKEAIAIVVAPRRNPNFGVFRLRDPYGMKVMQNCDLRGFHPHEKGLYNGCDHVTVNWKDPTYLVVDLR